MRQIQQLGDAALLITWPDEAESLASRRARAVARHLLDAAPGGLRDSVIGARSLLLKFDPDLFDESGFSLRLNFWEKDFASIASLKRHEILVWYGGEAGVDLEEVAAQKGMSPGRFVELQSGAEYTVGFIGFSPGFPYLTGLPEKLGTPRLPSPRTNVPAGSVAIGGPYCGIYPSATPGGWRLIGRTPTELFDPTRDPPAFLSSGDKVRFVAIDQARFARIVSERTWRR